MRSPTTLDEKVGYVRYARSHEDRHTCHWPGCTKRVRPALWGCLAHWNRLPKNIRDRIWRTFQPGQEITKQPSSEYLNAAAAAQSWIAEFEKANAQRQRRPDHG